MSKRKLETRREQRQARREERRLAEQRQRAAKKRLIIWVSTIVSVIVVVVAAIITSNILGNKSALASDNPAYPVVDNIACQTGEKFGYHVHAHLSIYVDDQPVSLPANIGIASDGSCIYWLHTHDTKGVIHIESPNATTYSLETFFKMWQDYFSQLGYPSQLSTPNGWQVYINGKAFDYKNDFRNIHIESHMLITLAYNSPDIPPDTTYSWGSL
jgi:hypothetical protein